VGSRGADGAPRFDAPLAPGGYRWWYVDAVSDDGAHALTLIAFVGSAFSPYYARALARAARGGPSVRPEDHAAINLALYGPAMHHWAMTERSAATLSRTRDRYALNASALEWRHGRLEARIDERGFPWPRALRGRITVEAPALTRFTAALDAAGRHRWAPIAPAARVVVEFERPALAWRGHGYLDSNEGDEPIASAFRRWDWARAPRAGGGAAVVYDVTEAGGSERVIARRFDATGAHEAFEAPARHRLPPSAWRVERALRSDTPPAVHRMLEDTPFYVRSEVQAQWAGEPVRAVHESLAAPRLASPIVQWMLPFRMPRRG
jgi:carotenoid 1,2-hydratase